MNVDKSDNFESDLVNLNIQVNDIRYKPRKLDRQITEQINNTMFGQRQSPSLAIGMKCKCANALFLVLSALKPHEDGPLRTNIMFEIRMN